MNDTPEKGRARVDFLPLEFGADVSFHFEAGSDYSDIRCPDVEFNRTSNAEVIDAEGKHIMAGAESATHDNKRLKIEEDKDHHAEVGTVETSLTPDNMSVYSSSNDDVYDGDGDEDLPNDRARDRLHNGQRLNDLYVENLLSLGFVVSNPLTQVRLSLSLGQCLSVAQPG
ncbi:Ff.00g064760.m01.CDS01 [Fusarium sp. VM40]|nr:Ff.00g064760.m01.CDS01 [Fusarium sp. VM40]